MVAGNEAVSRNDAFWWITAYSTPYVESLQLCYKRETLHILLWQNLWILSTLQLEPLHNNNNTFTQTLIYSCFFSLRQASAGSTSNLHHAVFVFCTDIEFAVMGVSWFYNIPILNVKWERVYWMLIRLQQLRCFYSDVPQAFRHGCTRRRTCRMILSGHLSYCYLWFIYVFCPYWGIGDEPLLCPFAFENSNLSYFFPIDHRRPKMFALVKVPWQIVLL